MNRNGFLSYILKVLAGWFLATTAWALVHWLWKYFTGHAK